MRKEEGRGLLRSRIRPDNMPRYDPDEISSAVNKFIEPEIHCELQIADHPENGNRACLCARARDATVSIMSAAARAVSLRAVCRASLCCASSQRCLHSRPSISLHLAAGHSCRSLAESTGLSSEAASRSLALCSLAGIVGASIVVAAGSRFGRLVPLIITLSLFASPFAVFALTSTPPAIFVSGQLFIGLTWTMIVPYFEDIQSALNRTGRLTVLGMVAATVAAAAGPGAFGFLVGHGDDYRHAFLFALLAFAVSALCSIDPGKRADARRTWKS